MNPNQLFDKFRSESARLYSAVLADILDDLGHRHQTLSRDVVPLNFEWKLFGKARTLAMKDVDDTPEHPYALEMKAIDDLHEGDVLVIAMNGCRECAVWGELLSTASKARGATGALMDGPTRDSEKILELGFATFSTGASPLDSKGRIDGVAWDKPITIGGVACKPGDLIFGDRDGVVVIPFDVAGAVLDAALEKVSGENVVREELAAGRAVSEVFAKYGIL